MTKSQSFKDFYGSNYRSPLELNFERGFNFRRLYPKFSKRRYDELEEQWWHLRMTLPYGSILPEIIEELRVRPLTIDEAQKLHLLEVVWVWPHGRDERALAVRLINILILRPPGPFQQDNPAKSTPLVYWLDPENPNHHAVLDYLDVNAPDGLSDNIQISKSLPTGLFDGFDDDDLLTEDEIIARGIDRFAWESYSFEVSPLEPEKTRLKKKEREQLYIREIALDALARTYFTARARAAFIREQIEMLNQEQQLLENLSYRPASEEKANDHIPAVDKTGSQPDAVQAKVPVKKPNQIPPRRYRA